jgi:hypothetical protein
MLYVAAAPTGSRTADPNANYPGLARKGSNNSLLGELWPSPQSLQAVGKGRLWNYTSTLHQEISFIEQIPAHCRRARQVGSKWAEVFPLRRL